MIQLDRSTRSEIPPTRNIGIGLTGLAEPPTSKLTVHSILPRFGFALTLMRLIEGDLN